MTTERDRLDVLLDRVLATEPVEIDCDEFLERVSAYVETLGGDGPLPPELAPVAQHLRVCPECTEELDALLRALEP